MLSITFGTPSGSARIAAVPMVVPAEPPSASTPDSSPRAYASRASRAAPSAALVTASPRSACLPHGLERRPRQLEDALARDVGGDCRAAERADVDERHGDAPRRQQVADEGGLAALGVERREEEDGGHSEAHYIQ